MCDHDWILLTTKDLDKVSFGFATALAWGIRGCKNCHVLHRIGGIHNELRANKWIAIEGIESFDYYHYWRGFALFGGGR